MQRVSFGHEAHVRTAFGRVGTRHTPKFLSTSPMKQKRKLQQKPTKSRAWLEAECLKLARGPSAAAKSNASQSDGCIRKAWAPIGRSPISQPTPLVSGEVRAAAPVQ